MHEEYLRRPILLYSVPHTHKYTLCRGYFCRRHTLSSLLSPRAWRASDKEFPLSSACQSNMAAGSDSTSLLPSHGLKPAPLAEQSHWGRVWNGPSLCPDGWSWMATTKGHKEWKGTRSGETPTQRKSHLDFDLARRVTSNHKLHSLTVWETTVSEISLTSPITL